MNARKLYPGQMKPSERGKIRILSLIEEKNVFVCEVTNDISAFDVVLPPQIPGKGAVLNLIAADGMRKTKDICPNCLIGVPHARVSLWKKATPFKVEMVIRGYLVGHASREYKEGKRMICGVPMPEGMVENQKFPEPIITPTTKAVVGHDEDISKEEIISSGLVSKEDYELLEKYTYALFQRGTEIAEKNGLILVDTKYEFGKDKNGTIMLIDEVHTPDSSRYFYKDGYEEKFAKGEPQRELSKEFVRKWLIEQGFQGRPGDVVPEFTDEIVQNIADRYKELYSHMGASLIALPADDDSDLYESVCTLLRDIHN